MYDRGDYNSSFALRAVELKSRFSHNEAHMLEVLIRTPLAKEILMECNILIYLIINSGYL